MKKKSKIIFLVVCCLSMFLITGCKTEEAGGNTQTGTNQSKPTYSASELSKNITSSSAFTKAGKLVVIAKNNNKVDVNIDIEVEFYDEKGTIVGTDSTSLLAVGPNNEIAVDLWSTPKSFDTYKLYVDAEQTDLISYYDKVELTHNNNGDLILVQIKNNSEDTIEFLSIGIIYYQGDEVVGATYDLKTDVKSGRSANFTLRFPYDENYREVAFDTYKVFINEAYSFDWK